MARGWGGGDPALKVWCRGRAGGVLATDGQTSMCGGGLGARTRFYPSESI